MHIPIFCRQQRERNRDKYPKMVYIFIMPDYCKTFIRCTVEPLLATSCVADHPVIPDYFALPRLVVTQDIFYCTSKNSNVKFNHKEQWNYDLLSFTMVQSKLPIGLECGNKYCICHYLFYCWLLSIL